MPNLEAFDNLGGIPCYYARKNAAYADPSLCAKSRRRKIEPAFRRQLTAAILEIAALMRPQLGVLEAITSGGAYVEKPGFHRLGRAFDLGGLVWNDGVYTCLAAADVMDGIGDDSPRRELRDLFVYLAAESVLRKWFGTVIGIHYDKAHRNHLHIDNGTPVEYRKSGKGSGTRVRYLQVTLTHVWQANCGAPDGEEGPKTRAAMGQVLREFGISPIKLQPPSNWIHYCGLTAFRAMQLV